ncbi:MAG: uracil phosphoribosyltransferase [Paludibacteraceae bacterium]|nr:uracil phosphoribosyltransferase [Paludibacteraceae bacterium]
MKIINLSEQPSLLQQFLLEIRNRNIQTDSMRFRRNIERIGEVMALEISKTLNYRNEQIQTPLASIQVPAVTDKIVLGTVLRAGLPFHSGFLNYFDHAENAFVSAYRSYTDEAHTQIAITCEYKAAPDLNGKTLLLVDPMLATAGSMYAAYQSLLDNGTPARIDIACVIATPVALEYLKQVMPEQTTVWCAAIDPVLNEQKYIVPGLGDAGDLCYGDKL